MGAQIPSPQKIKLAAVVKGACWLAVDGERARVRLDTGDVLMVPAERSFVLASDLKEPQVEGLALFTKATDNVGKVGVGEDFFAIGGHIALDPERGGVVADVFPARDARQGLLRTAFTAIPNVHRWSGVRLVLIETAKKQASRARLALWRSFSNTAPTPHPLK